MRTKLAFLVLATVSTPAICGEGDGTGVESLGGLFATLQDVLAFMGSFSM